MIKLNISPILNKGWGTVILRDILKPIKQNLEGLKNLNQLRKKMINNRPSKIDLHLKESQKVRNYNKKVLKKINYLTNKKPKQKKKKSNKDNLKLQEKSILNIKLPSQKDLLNLLKVEVQNLNLSLNQ